MESQPELGEAGVQVMTQDGTSLIAKGEVKVAANDPAGDIPGWLLAGRIPCLDGLRALAILLVIGQHLVQKEWARGASADAFLALGPGNFGVYCFFVISGFLITILLLRERTRRGKISLFGFYTRRARRIFPAYLTYVFVVIVLSLTGWIATSPRDWAIALTYVSNYTAVSYPLAHTWSLSLEEQFYLLWPPVLSILGARRAKVALAVFLALAPGFRVVERLLFHGWAGHTYTTTLTGMDSIAAGCLMALCAMDGSLAIRRKASLVWLGAVSFALLLPSSVACRYPAYHLLLGRSVNAVCLCGVVWALANLPDSPIGRFLRWRPMVLIGTLSYSLYLWQQLFIGDAQNWLFQPPQSLVAMLLVAVTSYRFIELPFLRYRKGGETPIGAGASPGKSGSLDATWSAG